MGTGYGNPPDPSRELQGDSSLRRRLGPHPLCSVSALRICDLSKCDENVGTIHSPHRMLRYRSVVFSLLMPALKSPEKVSHLRGHYLQRDPGK